jgi:ParB family chromosome partitioning protein
VNVGKNYFEQAERGKTTWVIAPEDLILVTDEKDPLYDPRVKAPLDQSLVSNIGAFGVIEPVVVTRRDGQAVVVVGRQRVRAAREVNRRFKAEGKVQIKVPCIAREGEDGDLFGLMISENEQRRGDSPLDRARKAKRMLDMNGGDRVAVIAAFGITSHTLTQWLGVFELAPAVRQAVDREEVSFSAAMALKDMPRAKQEQTLETAKAKAKAEKKPGAVEKKVTASKLAGAPKMRTRKQIEKRLATPNLPPDYAAALRWTLGQE